MNNQYQIFTNNKPGKSITGSIVKSGAGFTLVEALVTIAIMGILTSVMFVDFSKQKNRDAVKIAADQIATDIRQIQAYAQGGFVPAGKSTPADAYGLALAITQADKGCGASNMINHSNYLSYAKYTTPPDETAYNCDGTDVVLRKKIMPTDTQVIQLKLTNGTATGFGERVDVVFGMTSGKTTLIQDPDDGRVYDRLTATIKLTALNLCYSVGIQIAGKQAIVMNREKVNCP